MNYYYSDSVVGRWGACGVDGVEWKNGGCWMLDAGGEDRIGEDRRVRVGVWGAGWKRREQSGQDRTRGDVQFMP